jgi:hypothetical protein
VRDGDSIQSAVGGDGDAETGSGEGVHEGPGWMVSIVFTPIGGDEKIRQEDRNKKKYRKGFSRKATAEGRRWERETKGGERRRRERARALSPSNGGRKGTCARHCVPTPCRHTLCLPP